MPPPHTHGQLHLSAGHFCSFSLLTTTKPSLLSFVSMVFDDDDDDELLDELLDELELLELDEELDELDDELLLDDDEPRTKRSWPFP